MALVRLTAIWRSITLTKRPPRNIRRWVLSDVLAFGPLLIRDGELNTAAFEKIRHQQCAADGQ